MSGFNGDTPPKPQLIVGIDFGLTGTAVAWALPFKDEVRTIDTWPGMENHAGKVPSTVVLLTEGGSAWGFSTGKYCDSSQYQVYSLFKTPIGMDHYPAVDNSAGDNAHGDEPEGPGHAGSRGDTDEGLGGDFQSEENTMDFPKAKICLAAYLEGLYAHIKKVLSRELSRELRRNTEWRTTRIWFLFSYPTTWHPAAIERFSKIVDSSGFGREESHWVHASYMDEAQAAMASFSSRGSRPAPGKIIAIADIGGGTTDVNKYGVEDDDGKRVKLKVETDPSGQYHGSVDVDYRVMRSLRSEVMNTLNAANNSAFRSMDLDSKKLVVENQAMLALGRINYVATKHGVDKESPTNHKELHPLFLKDSATPVATLEFQLYKALKRELRKECEKVWYQIEEHLKTGAEGSVDQLVLTGGMTKNAFVQDWFEEKLESSRAGGSPNPIKEIVFLREPELAVSKGLVHDALESYKRDGLWMYKSRHTYGIVVYNSDEQVEMKRKFLEKNQVIDPKKFKEKQTIRFKSADKVDLWLARWDKNDAVDEAKENDKGSGKNGDGIKTVGSLTTGLPAETEWDPSWSVGRDAKTEVELRFERRTIIVTFWSKGKTEHRRIFNAEWHSGTPSKPAKSSPNFARLARIGLGVLGMISSIIIGVDPFSGGGNDRVGPDANRGANHAAAEDNGDNDDTEEGVGQFDDFAE